ncbi:penicillin acylase family protein [Massilia phyllosphaerae]|uniref:penicillin acylase family protein n=1 Tax=Massilia phyllosphaerae TaxID=3106034 RepID=UPI002B1CD414|nr:penicillin acylase family protein [Massilia sp. SGZ-792]
MPLLVLAAAAAWYFQSSKPQVNGTVWTKGLGAPVTMTRDVHGVVHIKAASERDVYFAMGYAHAQDRLWQLEFQRRIAQGRLSELFGRKAVRQDIWLRTLGLYRSAESAWPALSEEARASLTAYADGINAVLEAGAPLPPEFALLGTRPERWRPIDSLAWIKVFALNLGGNLNQEIERYLAGQTLDASRMQALFGPYPAGAPTTVPDPFGGADKARTGKALAGLLDLRQRMEQDIQIGGRFVGSNAWVTAGRLSEGGKPILANDPHLGLQMPSLWYAVSQQGGRLQASGMSLVGLPIVLFGKNQHIAWGGTNMMADVQDLFVEQVDVGDPGRYRSAGGWKRFAAREEIVKVKAAFPASLHEPLAPLRIQVRESEHGPIVSDMLNVFDQPVALRWTALDAGDTTYESFFRLNYAGDWAAFKAALALHVAPTLNMLYADQAGNIGYLGVGHVPLRASGNGSLPVADAGAHGWTGFIPAAAMPQSFNPARGYIVSANNKVVGPDYPYFISNDWAPPARAERIEQLLGQEIAAGRPISLAYMEKMQSDLQNREAQQLLPILNAYPPRSQRQRDALRYLAGWDGNMGLDSQAASIYMSWTRHLRRQLFGAHLAGYWNQEGRESYLDSVVANTSADTLRTALTSGRGAWCGQAGAAPSCGVALSASLDTALDELTRLKGSDMDGWRWGALHTTLFKHTPFSDVKLLDMVFTRKLASGGAPATVNAANASFVESKGYVQGFGAAFRQIIQPGAGRHLYINSTGQSGHPLSAHYDDMVEPFGQGRYFNMASSAPAGVEAVLTLAPLR